MLALAAHTKNWNSTEKISMALCKEDLQTQEEFRDFRRGGEEKERMNLYSETVS